MDDMGIQEGLIFGNKPDPIEAGFVYSCLEPTDLNGGPLKFEICDSDKYWSCDHRGMCHNIVGEYACPNVFAYLIAGGEMKNYKDWNDRAWPEIIQSAKDAFARCKKFKVTMEEAE